MHPKTEADAILWIHETVGCELDGHADLQECIEYVRKWGSDLDRHILDWHVLAEFPQLEERESVKRLADAVAIPEPPTAAMRQE